MFSINKIFKKQNESKKPKWEEIGSYGTEYSDTKVVPKWVLKAERKYVNGIGGYPSPPIIHTFRLKGRHYRYKIINKQNDFDYHVITTFYRKLR